MKLYLFAPALSNWTGDYWNSFDFWPRLRQFLRARNIAVYNGRFGGYADLGNAVRRVLKGAD